MSALTREAARSLWLNHAIAGTLVRDPVTVNPSKERS